MKFIANGKLNELEKYYPGINLLLTLEKAVSTFWATEAGWENKKKKRIKNINWDTTFKNSLSQKQNHVYKPKEPQISFEQIRINERKAITARAREKELADREARGIK